MKKVLVIDDEIDVCDFVKHFFEARGFRVYTALNGSEGLRVFRRERPGIILLDVKMKQMNGIETLKKIRGISKTVKVIMVTGVAEQDVMEKANALGASEYITKPLILEELETAVMAYTGEGNNAAK